jgi:hypothetical protein
MSLLPVQKMGNLPVVEVELRSQDLSSSGPHLV